MKNLDAALGLIADRDKYIFQLEAETEALKAELRGARERLLTEMYNNDTISQVQFDHAIKEIALLTGGDDE